MRPSRIETGQVITFVLNPLLKGQITSRTEFADGGVQYKVSYFGEDGTIHETSFFPCELIYNE